MDEGRAQQVRWLRALHEPLANVRTAKRLVCVGDVRADGEHRLVLADAARSPARLLLHQGLTPVAEAALSDLPAGLVAFVCETGHNETPCVAVATGGSVLVYRNMKPYYRFSVPALHLHPPELQLWEAARHSPHMPADVLLSGLRDCLKEVGLARLTVQSKQFLGQSADAQREDLLERVRSGTEPMRLTNVHLTCIATMKKSEKRADGVDVLVLGAELGAIYWTDSQAFTVLDSALIQGSPDIIYTLGLFDIECRTFVVTRENDVVILKKSGRNEQVQSTFFIRSPIIGLTYSINQLVFATKDQRLLFYSVRGKCLNELRLDGPVADIEPFHYEPRQYRGVLVAVGAEIRLYVELFLVDRLRAEAPVVWLRFGRLGREEGVLLFGTTSGGLYCKVFRRTAVLGERAPTLGAPAAQSQRLNVPKRTKAFIDQSLRERENPQRLHKIYQRDLFMLKYHVTKTYAALQSGETGMLPSRDVEPVDFNIDLIGFGPVFKLIVNLSASRPLPSARRVISFVWDSREYTMAHNIIHLPEVIPANMPLKLATHITCLHPEKQATSEVRVLMVRAGWTQPVFSSTVAMPISEPDIN